MKTLLAMPDVGLKHWLYSYYRGKTYIKLYTYILSFLN